MIQAATVRSRERFTRRVGQNMGEALKKQLGQAPNACWLFCAPLEGMDKLLKGIRESIGTANLVGCTSAGEISSDGVGINSAVLGGIATDQIDFEIAAATGLCRDSEEAGRQLAAAFSRTPRYIQIFTDGITGNGSAILKGMAAVLGENIPIAGGNAGDNERYQKTMQFAGDKIYTDSICGIAFYGNFRLGTGVRSGWIPIGLTKKVTRAAGPIVYELNGEPALNVYERFLGKHAEKLPAIAVEYPLCLLERWGDVGQEDYFLMRATISVNREDRSITFAGEVPEGAMVNMACGDSVSILNAAEKAVTMAISDLGDLPPAIAFCYSCTARKTVLGRRCQEEIDRVHNLVGSEVPIIGFYTYGEYSRLTPWSPTYLHNETFTVSLLGV
ncbi:MAG: FIST N-terminal domain-containing protein [Pseudomonadota bacterium]